MIWNCPQEADFKAALGSSAYGIWQRFEIKLAISQLIDSEWDSDLILSGKLFAKRSFDDNAQ